jgi:hypothetical protein
MNTLDIFNILDTLGYYDLYIQNLLSGLHIIVSNETAFNLLCGEILPNSAQIC